MTARISQKKAKLLVRDYINSTGSGGVSEIMSRLSDFHGYQPFNPRTMSNWLSDKTENLNSGNWPILLDFIQTDTFQKVVPWATPPNEEVIYPSDVQESGSEKRRLRKRFAKQGNANPESVRLIPPRSANTPSTDINGYWSGENLLDQAKIYILVSAQTTGGGLGKFALVSIGQKLMEVHTGVFEDCFEIFDKLYSYPGVSWLRADPSRHFTGEVRVDERTSNIDIMFYSSKLAINCGKISYCETVPDNIRKLLDVKIQHVLPHHG